MPLLITVGENRESAMDQAAGILGDNVIVDDEGNWSNQEYLQFNSASPVVPVRAFRAGVADGSVYVYWVRYHKAPD